MMKEVAVKKFRTGDYGSWAMKSYRPPATSASDVSRCWLEQELLGSVIPRYN